MSHIALFEAGLSVCIYKGEKQSVRYDLQTKGVVCFLFFSCINCTAYMAAVVRAVPQFLLYNSVSSHE